MTGNNSTTQGKTKHTKTYRLIMQSKTDKKTNSRPNYFVWTFCLYELLLLTVPKRRGNENAYFYRCRKKILTSESDTYSDHYSTLFTPERQTSAETSLTLFPYRGVVHSTFLELTHFLLYITTVSSTGCVWSAFLNSSKTIHLSVTTSSLRKQRSLQYDNDNECEFV